MVRSHLKDLTSLQFTGLNSINIWQGNKYCSENSNVLDYHQENENTARRTDWMERHWRCENCQCIGSILNHQVLSE